MKFLTLLVCIIELIASIEQVKNSPTYLGYIDGEFRFGGELSIVEIELEEESLAAKRKEAESEQERLAQEKHKAHEQAEQAEYESLQADIIKSKQENKEAYNEFKKRTSNEFERLDECGFYDRDESIYEDGKLQFIDFAIPVGFNQIELYYKIDKLGKGEQETNELSTIIELSGIKTEADELNNFLENFRLSITGNYSPDELKDSDGNTVMTMDVDESFIHIHK